MVGGRWHFFPIACQQIHSSMVAAFAFLPKALAWHECEWCEKCESLRVEVFALPIGSVSKCLRCKVQAGTHTAFASVVSSCSCQGCLCSVNSICFSTQVSHLKCVPTGPVLQDVLGKKPSPSICKQQSVRLLKLSHLAGSSNEHTVHCKPQLQLSQVTVAASPS